MSLEFIAAGVLICLFGVIGLMPSFDGKWDNESHLSCPLSRA
jgi:hypothetical protein